MNLSRRDDITPYVTRDGSEIRELLHPDRHAVRHQSLAEATVAPGTAHPGTPPPDVPKKSTSSSPAAA
jgi:hypothetical protein